MDRDQTPRNTLARLREANLLRHREWAKGKPVSLSFRACELAGETGEACNIVKKIERAAAGWVGAPGDVEHLADELADVVICADLLAMDLGIDLEAAIERKFNFTSIKYGLNTRLNPVSKSEGNDA